VLPRSGRDATGGPADDGAPGTPGRAVVVGSNGQSAPGRTAVHRPVPSVIGTTPATHRSPDALPDASR
jgi:hypothetical protein